MKFIKPLTLTDAMLTSSTVPETDYTAWSAATAYVVGNKCILVSTHRIYECLVNNTNFSPDVNTSGLTPKWLDIGPTNRHAMFDDVIGTKTTSASAITTVIKPGVPVGGLGLMELVGGSITCIMKDSPSGTVVYTTTKTLDGTEIFGVYDWFFTPYEQLTQVTLTDLPTHFYNCELTITVSPLTSESVACGVCKFGEVIDIGGTQYGATSGIVDYSRKEVDAFGNYSFTERAYSKTADFNVAMPKTQYNKVSRRLADVRAKPCVYIGTEVDGYEPLTIYGRYKDFSINVEYFDTNYCTLQIEGLV